MHEPKPYGLFSYGEPLTEQDFDFVDHCAKKLLNFKTVSNLDSLKYTRSLPDGGTVILVHSGGVFRAICYKPGTEQSENKATFQTHMEVPFLFSGIVEQPVSKFGKGIGVRFTTQTQRRLSNYEGKGPGYLELQRFLCNYAANFRMFIPESVRDHPAAASYSQYHEQHATWYSGAMAEVVQIVGGYGRQNFEELPDDPFEQLRYQLPYDLIERIKPEIENCYLPGYTGNAPINGQYQYNFQFNDTDLVAFDEKREPWLIKVNNVGVWAMPLPLVPATTTMPFREYIENKGDEEIKKILDRFGGMPSGEGFPVGADFYRWVRAGAIIQLCDAHSFYHYSPYTTACGWSSNLDCTEAINTCYDYADDGFCYGYTFMLRFNMLSAEHRGWAKRKQVSSDWSIAERDLLSSYLAELSAALGETGASQNASIRYKLRRVDESAIMDRARSHNGGSDVEYWDNLSLNPISQSTASMALTNQGYLHEGRRMKLPEPFMGGCISMDFTPIGEKDIYPYIDTIIFAYYIGDDLKVVKNYRDDRNFDEKIISNFEENMIVGSWEEQKLYGGVYNGGAYYSSDFDDRKEIAAKTNTTTIYGKDQGWGKPLAAFGAYFWVEGILTRSRYYTHKKTEQRTNSITIREGFIVPYRNRNMSFYGRQETQDKGEYLETLRQYSIQDPNSYGFWTYDFAWHWAGSYDNTMPRKGQPRPIDSFPVWAEQYNYKPTPTSDFADYGDWIGGLPADVTHIVHPPNGINILTYGGDPPPVEEYTIRKEGNREEFYKLGCSVTARATILHDQPHTTSFYALSPNPETNVVVYEDACKVVFGNAEYANISLKNLAGQKYRFGYTRLNETHEAKAFIGVINE